MRSMSIYQDPPLLFDGMSVKITVKNGIEKVEIPESVKVPCKKCSTLLSVAYRPAEMAHGVNERGFYFKDWFCKDHVTST